MQPVVMQAHLDQRSGQTDLEATEVERKGARHYAKRISSILTKYVTFDKDAIFKDPNWPYLWS